MQEITNNLKTSLNKQTPVYSKSVVLYRRIWITDHYEFDSPIEILGEIIDAGKLYWKLDKEGFNEWTLSNTTLTVRNQRQQWKQDNPKGLFPDPYLLHGSKIKIRVGAQLADGSVEQKWFFSGFINTDPIAGSDDKSAVITLTSSMGLFALKSAGGISNPITNEAHAYSAPGVVDYQTINNGVAAEDFVVKRGATAGGAGAAAVILPTTGYKISDNDTKGIPLKVTLVSALTATESLWFDYKYWYTDKTYEWLVAQVCSLCGIPDTAITPAIFSSSIKNTWDFNSQVDWNTCSLSNIDTITTPGSFKAGLIDDFGDNEYAANPTWTELKGIGDWSADSGKLQISPTSIIDVLKMAQASAPVIGNWQFRLTTTQIALNDYCNIYIIGDTEDVTYKYPTHGYYLHFTVSLLQLRRSDGTVLISITNPLSSDMIRISRDSSGVFKLYVGEVLQGTSTEDTTYNTSAGVYITALTVNAPPWNAVFYFDDFYFWANGTTLGTGILTSPAHGAITGLNSWGKLAATYTANGATILIETSVWNGASWDAWTAIDGSGQILSTLYATTDIKYRVTATIESMTNPITPIFDEIVINYYTSTTLISFVNLTGRRCDQVLLDCSIHPCYEMGYNANDVFIYRPRSTTLPAVIELKSATNVIKLQNIVPGIDRVFNKVVASFGIYTVTADTTGDSEPSSQTKYGTIEYDVPSSPLLPADNVNIAYAIAPTILAYSKAPRRRCQAVCKALPYLELGDKVTLWYEEPTALRPWRWGQTDAQWGQTDIEYYSDAYKGTRLAFWGTEMRIEGMELEYWNNWFITVDLVEVL